MPHYVWAWSRTRNRGEFFTHSSSGVLELFVFQVYWKLIGEEERVKEDYDVASNFRLL